MEATIFNNIKIREREYHRFMEEMTRPLPPGCDRTCKETHELTVKRNVSLCGEVNALREENKELREAKNVLQAENERIKESLVEISSDLTRKLNCKKMEIDELVKHIDDYKSEIKQLKIIIRAFEAGSGKTILEE